MQKKSVHSFIEKSFISDFRSKESADSKDRHFSRPQNYPKDRFSFQGSTREKVVFFFNRNFLLRFVGFDITVCPFCMLLHPDFDRDELSFSIQSIERARFCQECQFQSLWQMVGPSFFWGNRLCGGLSLCFFIHFSGTWTFLRPWGWKGAKSPVICWRSHVYVRGAQEPWKSPTYWPPFFLRPTKCPLRWTKWRWTWFSHLFPTTTGRKSREVEDFFLLLVCRNFCLSLWTPSGGGFPCHVESWRATDFAFVARQLVRVN